MEFEFVADLDRCLSYEYAVLVTNDDDLDIAAAGQLYRDRADCENVFDEIKNQWGWAGFVTRDLSRCRIIARLIALIYNFIADNPSRYLLQTDEKTSQIYLKFVLV